MSNCVQSLKVTGSGTSVTSAAFASATTGGNFIGVSVGVFAGANTTASASDNNSSSFNTRATSPAAADAIKLIISAAENITGRSGHTVTGATTSSGDITVVAAEYDGVMTSSAFDVSAVNDGAGTSAPTGTTGGLAQADELVLGAVYSFTSSGNISSPTTTTSGAVGTSATTRQEQDRGAGETLAMADKESTSTAGQDITFTWDASEDWFSCVATFKLAPSFTLEQKAAQYRNDNGSETTATDAAAQDANVTHPLNTNLRYRALIQATGDPPSAAYTLRYELNAAGGYVAVPATQPSVSAAVLAASSSTSNASTYDTASVTLTAGKLYIIAICHSDAASEQQATGIATVGGAEAFTLIDSQVFDTLASNVHRLSVWRCVPSSTVTAAVRITLNDAGTGCAWQLIELTDSIITGTDGADAIGTPVKDGQNAVTSISVTPGALANSRSIQLAFGAHDLNNTGDVASGTNWNSVGTGVAYATPNTTLEFATNTSGTAQAVTFSTAGSADRAIIAFEVKAFTHPVVMSASANITGGGEDTTSQLTGGSGSFTTGRMWDDENGTDPTDLGDDNQAEFEWCVQAVSPAVNTDVIRLRVYRGSTPLDTYTSTPTWTVGVSAFTGTAGITIGGVTADGDATFSPGTKTATAAVTVGGATANGAGTFIAPIYDGEAAVSIGGVTADGDATFAPGTKTATGAVSIGAVDADGSATFSPGTKTASGAVAIGPVDADGSATFTPPVYTGVASLTIGAVDADGSATFVTPVYTGVAALSIGAVDADGSATHTTPVYTGTAALTIGAADADGSATFATQSYTATVAVSTGPAVAAASGTVTVPVYTGTASPSIGGVTADAAGTFSPGTKTASGAVTIGAVDADGSATFTVPTYTGTAALSIGGVDADGSATFSPGTKTATAALSIGAVDADGSATHTIPVYTGTATLSIGPVAADGDATFSPGTKTATAALSIGVVTAALSGTFAVPVYTGVAAASVGAIVADAAGTFSPGTKTASGAVSVGGVVADGDATFAAPVYTADAALSLGGITADGTAIFATVVYQGAAAVSTGAATAAASGTFVAPVYEGEAALSVGPIVAAMSGTFTPPVYTGVASLTIGAVDADGSATHVTPTYTGNAAVSIGAVDADGVATNVNPTYLGSAAVSVGGVTANGSATYVVSLANGVAAVSIGGVDADGAATHVTPTYTGVATVSIGSVLVGITGSSAESSPCFFRILRRRRRS